MESISPAESDLPLAVCTPAQRLLLVEPPDNVGSRYNTYFSGHLSGFVRPGGSRKIHLEVSQQYATLLSKGSRPISCSHAVKTVADRKVDLLVRSTIPPNNLIKRYPLMDFH